MQTNSELSLRNASQSRRQALCNLGLGALGLTALGAVTTKANPKTLRAVSLAIFALLAAALSQPARAQSSPTFTTLYRFTGGSDQGSPFGALVQARDGNLYGTTQGDGTTSFGTVFVTTTAGALRTLYTFAGGTDGSGPTGLVQGNDGNFYGTTAKGGAFSGRTVNGTVYKLTPAGVKSTLYSFSGSGGDSGNPKPGLLQGTDGNFYGTTGGDGGNDLGSVFRITATGTLTTLYTFAPQGTDRTHGAFPDGGLVQGSDGDFYGTTFLGGPRNQGTVFKITPAGVLTTLFLFTGDANGIKPTAGLVQGNDGAFYGTTFGGTLSFFDTTSVKATIFKITATGTLTTIYTFTGGDGADPRELLQAKDGNFYGETANGGTNNKGVLFKITPAGALTTLYQFTGGSDGANPRARLLQASDGNIYGSTSSGSMVFGSNPPRGAGTLFRLELSSVSAQLLNISTRLRVQTGDNALIGGFILTGSEAKRVILRAIGPSLAIPGHLENPTLELRDAGGTLLASNDNWKDTQQAEIAATMIPPSNELESAIVITLPANNASYTAIVRGQDNGTGIGLVEVYDLSQGANSKLANISTRGFVETGDNALIGGFILGPASFGNSRVILRAIGPSLPVNDALADPTLELHNGNGDKIASNDNWKINDATGQSQEAEIRATQVQPNNDLESAILTTLPPDNYTAIVAGKNRGIGVGLVEVYNLQ